MAGIRSQDVRWVEIPILVSCACFCCDNVVGCEGRVGPGGWFDVICICICVVARQGLWTRQERNRHSFEEEGDEA